MSSKHYFALIFVGTSFAAFLLWVGCGGSSAENPPTDSGADIAIDTTPPPKDTGGPESADAPTDAGCVSDVDLNTIEPPDAAINDAGATTALCVDCIRAHCNAAISTCNADCLCKNALVNAFDCVVEAGAQASSAFTQCATSAFSSDPNLLIEGYALYNCALANCPVECGFPPDAGLVDGGSDGGPDAGDASSE